jgi:hypothetical protein
VKVIEMHTGHAWAIEKDGLVFYSNEAFFGIQKYKINSPEFGGGPHKFLEQIISGVDPPEENWEEIAQQLYAMKEGFV